MNKHTVFSVLAAGALFITPVASIYAETSQDKLNSIKAELNETSQELESKQQEKQQIEQGVTALQQKIDALNEAIAKTEEGIAAIERDIQTLEQIIEEKKQHIAQLQEQIEKRQVVIDQRLQVLQEQPRIKLITEIIMNSSTVMDLLENMYSVSLILTSDKDILMKQVEDKKAVEQEQQAVKKKESQLQQQKEEQIVKQQQQAADKQQQEALINEMSAKLAEVMEEIESAEEAKELLEAQRFATQQLIAEEKRAAEEAAKAKQKTSSNVTIGNAINIGGFIKPTAGVFTSPFGPRWGKLHAGVDIAAPGHVPVMAAADGVVIRAYYSSSYGNVVFISHRIKGQTYTTVYAHLSSYSVSTGQSVKQGQQIGVMGNTGASQGQHLHFELHVGEWNQSKSNAVNPMPYL